MGKNDLAIIGLGALALFAFRKDVSNVIKPLGDVTGAVGGVAKDTGQSFREVTSVTEIVPVVVESTKTFIERETGQSNTRDNIKEKRKIKDEEAKNERNRLREDFKTDVTKGFIGAGKDVSKTFRSYFRPNPTQITERRAMLKSFLSPTKKSKDRGAKLKAFFKRW